MIMSRKTVLLYIMVSSESGRYIITYATGSRVSVLWLLVRQTYVIFMMPCKETRDKHFVKHH